MKRKFGKVSKGLKYYVHDCLKNFLLHFIFLLTAPIGNNSHVLAGIYFYLSKTRPGQKLKAFRYRILTSMKRSVKSLSSRTKFSLSSQLSCSNFWLKLC